MNKTRAGVMLLSPLVMSVTIAGCAYDDGEVVDVAADQRALDLERSQGETPASISEGIQDGTDVSERNGNCRSQVHAWSWRIRNASAPRANAWALRGLKFCEDASCETPLDGAVIHDGSAPSWGAAENIFDDDASDFWKSFAGRRIGEGYIGLIFDRPVALGGIAIRPDNVVYGVSDIVVEYYNVGEDAWITKSSISGLPLHYGDIDSGGPTYRNGTWHVEAIQCHQSPGPKKP
jgi:hypothetical protein